ncbi:MAG: hypothetical protein R3274_09280, partial [Desulfobacterales bacterium]|nr:hypothetical protein [Desulfobacterales bacterium]
MIKEGIAVIGSTTIDQIILRHGRTLKVGGVTVYSGMTYSRHGVNTLAITNIADGNPQVIDCLRSQRILVHNGQTQKTTCFINDIRADDRRQRNPQRAAPIIRQQVIDHVKNAAYVHLGPLHPKDIDIGAIKSVRAFDSEVILDIQGLVRAVKNGNVVPAVSAQITDALSVSHIVKANKSEYEVMINFFQTDLATLMRRYDVREFIVTEGARGGFVQVIDAPVVRYAAVAATSRGD